RNVATSTVKIAMVLTRGRDGRAPTPAAMAATTGRRNATGSADATFRDTSLPALEAEAGADAS
ncbi:MAG: hypothetical protein JWO86_1029, partial [Myxococcaceae bacterium]|nr:hypothetical protein [Myxococcaceae bacterium]